MRLLTTHTETTASAAKCGRQGANGIRLLIGIALALVIFSSSFFFGSPVVHAATTNRLVPHTSGNGYDFLDPVKTGCNRSAYQLGAVSSREDTYHARVYWSSACQTNYAYVISPDGSPLANVEIERSTATNVNCNQTSCCNDSTGTCTWYYANGMFNSEATCSQNTNGPCTSSVIHADNQCTPTPPDCIPDNTSGTTWLTNMLYSPNDQFRVVATTWNGTYFSSYWH